MDSALWWVLGAGSCPISGLKFPSADTTARIECEAALYIASSGNVPTAVQWKWFGHDDPPRITVGDTQEWAYGVWRVLAWLLGDIDAAPPTEDVSRWPWLPPAVKAEVRHAALLRRK